MKGLRQGYRTLLSSPWYLNLGGFAAPDWEAYYRVEPTAFGGSLQQQQLIIGGEVHPGVCIESMLRPLSLATGISNPRAPHVSGRLSSSKGPGQLMT